MTRRAWRFLVALALAATVLGHAGCGDSSERTRQKRENAYLATIEIRNFRPTVKLYTQSAQGVFVGPPTLDPAKDIAGLRLVLHVPPHVPSESRAFTAIADGDGVGADGVGCFVTIERFRGDAPFSSWELTASEIGKVGSGEAIVVVIGVVCGGSR